MKVFMVDNYDSFTYNLVHYLGGLNCQVTVKRNDQFDLEEVALHDRIVLSPGPGIPDEAGLLKSVIAAYSGKKPILGVCLGLQAIGEVFGATLKNLTKVYHGVETSIEVIVEDEPLFHNLGKKLSVGRYHSWVVQHPLPSDLEVTSLDDEGSIMSLRHRKFDVRGVQFHPESVLTPHGKQMLKNWIS